MNIYDEFEGYDINVYDGILLMTFMLLLVVIFFSTYTYPISVNFSKIIPSLKWDGFKNNKTTKKKQPSKEGFVSNSYSNINESFNMLQSYTQPKGNPLITFIN